MSYPIQIKKDADLSVFENMVEYLNNEEFYVITDFMNRCIYCFKENRCIIFYVRTHWTEKKVAHLSEAQKERMGRALESNCEVHIVLDLEDVKQSVIKLHDEMY